MVALQTGGSGYCWEKSGYSLGDQESVLTAERWGKQCFALVLQVGFAGLAVAHRNVIGKEGTRLRGKSKGYDFWVATWSPTVQGYSFAVFSLKAPALHSTKKM